MHRWDKAFDLGMLGLCAVLLVAGLALLGCSKREIPSDNPRPIAHAWIAATGQSMLPTFPERALVEIQIGVPFEALRAGDSVVFWDYTRATPQLIHHRLVQEQGGNWIAQGDNPETNPTADRPWVTRDNYIGRTTGRHVQILAAPR